MPSELLSREPVVAEEAFWGRQHNLRCLAHKLGGYTPQNCNVIGEPRIGKTSLMYHVYQQEIGLPEAVVGLYVWVRLVELAGQNSSEFWRLMLTRLEVAAEHVASATTIDMPDDERDIFDVLFVMRVPLCFMFVVCLLGTLRDFCAVFC